MLSKQRGFLTSYGNKITEGSYIQKLLDVKLLPTALAIIKTSVHSTLDSLEAKGNYLVDASTKNAALKTKNLTSVMVQRDVASNDNLEKLTRDTQQLAPEREKQYWKSTNCWFDKKREL